MGLFKYIILFLCMFKICSFSYLKEIKSTQANIKEFVDFEYNEIKDDPEYLNQTLLDWSKTRKRYHQAAKKLKRELDSLERNDCQNYHEWNEAFCHTPIGDKQPDSIFIFKATKGLSFEHNKKLLLIQGYDYALQSLVTSTEFTIPQSTIVELKKIPGDSLHLNLSKFETPNPNIPMTYIYKDIEHNIDSFPINVGPLDSPIQICINDPITKDKKCFKKLF